MFGTWSARTALIKELSFEAVRSGNLGSILTELKRKLIEPDSKFIRGSPKNSPSNSRRTCSLLSRDISSMFFRVRTSDAAASKTQLDHNASAIPTLCQVGLAKLMIFSSECCKAIIRTYDIRDAYRKFFIDDNNFTTCNQQIIGTYVQRLPYQTIQLDYGFLIQFQQVAD